MRKHSVSKNRILSRRGESLTETLVSVLVIALALLLLVSMVTASKNLIEKSETTFTNNYVAKNQAEEGSTGSTKKSDGTDSSTDTISISGTMQGNVTQNTNGITTTTSDGNFSYALNHKESVNAVETDTGIYTYEPVK